MFRGTRTPASPSEKKRCIYMYVCVCLSVQISYQTPIIFLYSINWLGPSSWLGGQSFWLLNMRSRVRFPVLPWEFSLAGEDPHSDHGTPRSHITSFTSSGQRNRALWAPHPHKSVTLRPQPGRGTTKSVWTDMWLHWGNKSINWLVFITETEGAYCEVRICECPSV
jgi:hypothetical protein